MSFINAMELYFLCFLSLPASFSCKYWKKLRLLLKTIQSGFIIFFWLSTVFWCSTPFTAIVVFWRIILDLVKETDCWWSCSSKFFFLASEVLIKLERFEMSPSFEPGAQIVFRRKWRKVHTLYFYFDFVVVNIFASPTAKRFFHMWVRF